MDAIVAAFANVLTPINLGGLIFGVAVGIVIGALPGLSVNMGIALLFPLTFSFQGIGGILMLLGIYCGAIYGGSISAILLKTPGTPASAATTLDGYPMAVKYGQPGRALGLSTFSSTFGGMFSAICLMVFSPMLAAVALQFSKPEYFALAVFGISIITSVSSGSVLKGLMGGLIGLIIATIGIDAMSGQIRMTFGTTYLLGGLSFVPILIGLFAFSQVLTSIEESYNETYVKHDINIKRVFPTMSDLKECIVTVLRSSVIGTFVGCIPGTGGDISSFISYNEAKRWSKHKEKFGDGAPEGICAPEAGNNAVSGGAMIPMLTLGIPGSAPAALFLSAMILHGVRPGPTLFTEHAETVYTMIIGFAVINLLMYFVGMFYCKAGSMILKIPKAILATSIVVLAVVGTFATNKNMFDVWVMFASGVIGYIMIRNDFPIAPIALSLLLGSNMEKAWSVTKTLYEGELYMIFTRPLAAILALLTIASFAFPIIKMWRKRKAAAAKTEAK